MGVASFIVQYRITKLLESALFYKLPAIRFHILTPFLVGKLVVLPPFRGAILPFEKNAEDFRIFFKKFLSSKIRLSEKPGQTYRYCKRYSDD